MWPHTAAVWAPRLRASRWRIIANGKLQSGTRRAPNPHLADTRTAIVAAVVVVAVAKRWWRQSKSSSYQENSVCFFRNQLIRMHAKPKSTTCSSITTHQCTFNLTCLIPENIYDFEQGRRDGVESGGTNSASEANRKFFDPTFWPVGGQNTALTLV